MMLRFNSKAHNEAPAQQHTQMIVLLLYSDPAASYIMFNGEQLSEVMHAVCGLNTYCFPSSNVLTEDRACRKMYRRPTGLAIARSRRSMLIQSASPPPLYKAERRDAGCHTLELPAAVTM